jgi:FkbM family methyltransferase
MSLELQEITPCNGAEIAGKGPIRITTSSQQWAFAAVLPVADPGPMRESESAQLIFLIDALVERGEIGIAVATPDLSEFLSYEERRSAGSDRTVFEIRVRSIVPGSYLVIRNTAPGVSSEISIYSVKIGVPQQVGANSSSLAAPGNSPEVWLDVGAHLGEKTFSHAARNPGLRVFAFEPNLKLACQLMGRLANYMVIPMAVDEKDGSAPFYVTRSAAASSLLPFSPEGLKVWSGGDCFEVEVTETVPTIRLDTFLSAGGISKVRYLKIDAQGSDLAVVRSLGERIHDVDQIELEIQITSVPLYSGGSQKQETIEFLKSTGFALVRTETQSNGREENLTFSRTPHWF